MARKVTGYQVVVDVHVATERLIPLSEEKRVERARQLAEDLIAKMKRHIDDVNPRYPWGDHYEAYIVATYADDEGEAAD